MSVDVLGYLTEKGLFPKRAPGDEFHVACPYCNEDQGKRGRLYVNCNPDAEIKGLHHCKLCDSRGSIVTLQKFFGDATEKQEREDTGYLRRAILATAADYYAEVLGENVVALRWLTAERGLSMETIDRFQLGWADGGLFRHLRSTGYRIEDIVATGLVHTERDTGKMVDFLNGHIAIPYIVAGSVVMIRGRAFGDADQGRKYVTPTGQKTRLYNSDVTWDATEICVCYADDTEVLTQQGWFKFPDLPHDIPVASWAVDGTIAWELPVAYQRYSHIGSMVHFHGGFSDLLVTPDHRVVRRTGRNSAPCRPTVREAKGLVGRHGVTLPVSGILRHEETDGPTALEAQIVAMVAADGGWKGSTRNGGVLFNIKKDRKKCRLRALLSAYGLSQVDPPGQGNFTMVRGWSERSVPSKPGWTRFLVHGIQFVQDHLEGMDGKAFSWSLLSWSHTARSALLDELGYWDGDRPGQGGVRYFTADPQSADVVTALAGISGWGAIRREDVRPERPNSGTNYVISLVPRSWRVLAHPPREVPDYNGYVYCLTVPSGFLLTRRNGKNTISGNCEGEFDCLVLNQLGYAAVACPGANVWQDAWTSYFTDVRRAWIVFDRDEREVGQTGALKVQGKLGSKARIVELPPHDHGKSKNDITEYVVVCGHTREDFDALLRANRGLLVTVAEAIEEHDSLQGQMGLRFGIHALDLLIRPGLLTTQIMVMLASTGTGKTQWLLSMFQRICAIQPDVKVLFISLEQTRGDWWERARRMYRFFNPGATDDDARRYWAERIWLVDRNRVTVEQFLGILDDFTAEVGRPPDLVGIDYLGYWAQSFKGDRYERTSDAIMAIKEIAKDQRLRILIPHQVNRSVLAGTAPSANSGRDSGAIEETADFLLTLWSDDLLHNRSRAERTGQYKLGVLKSRHGGAGFQHALQFAPASLSFALPEEPQYCQWARNELIYQNRYPHESWEQSQLRHQAGTTVDVDDFVKVEQRLWSKRQQVLT